MGNILHQKKTADNKKLSAAVIKPSKQA